jgi:hypothetical protein
MDMPFFPGRKLSPPEPLAVFLPPYYEGTGVEFLRRLGKGGPRVVDPFGQSPAMALELARNGAAVLLASPNPILRALLELQADPPPPNLIRGVLARLARTSPSSSSLASASSAETLEAHIRSLYAGTCAFCGRESEAEGYVWECDPDPRARPPDSESPEPEMFHESKKRKTRPRLISRICGCTQCGHVVEEPATPADEKSMPREGSIQMLYHLALERLAPLDDPYRMNAKEALDVYPSRSIYALFMILTRLELMQLDPAEKRCADLLLLSALDQAHILRGHAHAARERPRSLLPPARYREANIWRLIEKAAEDWSLPTRRVPFGKWREGDPLEEGVLMTFAGTARDLAAHLPALRPNAMISYLPRPNQAAWTLSAMWAGWLWGRATSEPLAGMLHRRRYDWNWHARALTASCSALAAHLPAETPVAGFLGEWEPAFLAAALWSFYQTGFALTGRAARMDTCTVQLLWSAPGPDNAPHRPGPRSLEGAADTARLAARTLISNRAEPVPWELLHAAAWSDAAHRHMLPPGSAQAKESDFTRCQSALAEAVEKDPEIESTKKEESESGMMWWLPGDETIISPLSDQVEVEVARILLEDGPLPTDELDRRICSFFPGLLTPEQRLLRACLESYGSSEDNGRTRILRPEDRPDSRIEELEQVRDSLAGLGEKMGFAARGGSELYWIDSGGQKKYCFVFTASAAVGRHLLQPVFAENQSWIVLPGGRATLVGYKLRRNVLLRRAVSKGWRFLKFRHIRRLLEDPYLRPENLDERMGLDPLEVTEDKVPYW